MECRRRHLDRCILVVTRLSASSVRRTARTDGRDYRVYAKENGVSQTSAERNTPKRQPRGLVPFVLDSAYLGGLLVTMPYLFCVGRGRGVMDHLRRQTQPPPKRRGDRPCLWVHGVSVGEILSARRFLQRFSKDYADWEIVLSTTTRAGLEAGKRHYPDRPIFSYPFDLSFLVRRAFDSIRPDLVIIVEHELWPNFLGHAASRDVPVVIVNGRLSGRSLGGYRWLSRLLRWPPRSVVQFCVEDETSAEGFRELGVPSDRICVTGNFKFDNVVTPSGCCRQDFGFSAKEWVLVATSTHPGEEEQLVQAFMKLRAEDPNTRIVLAPRRVERAAEIGRIVEKRGLQPVLWSQLETRRRAVSQAAATNGTSSANGNGTHSAQTTGPMVAGSNGNHNGNGRVNGTRGIQTDQILIVDTVGELQHVVPSADVVFVGGSLIPFGGHNVIEPASLGQPVVIGPHYDSFRQVMSAFLAQEAVVVVNDGSDLYDKLRHLKSHPEESQRLGERAATTVARNTGASERTFEAIQPIIAGLKGQNGH